MLWQAVHLYSTQLTPFLRSARRNPYWGRWAWYHSRGGQLLTNAHQGLKSLCSALEQYRNALDTHNGDIMTPPCLSCPQISPGSASVRDVWMYIMLHSLDNDFTDVALNFFEALENQD